MPCLTLTGYSKGCDQSLGGIKKLVLFEKAGMTIPSGITTGIVTTLTMAAGYSGYSYDFLKDNSNWVEPIVGDGILTSVHWEPTITAVFRKMSVGLRNDIYELSKNSVCAIIRDFNDTYWLLGSQRGLDLIASPGATSGNKLEELNGYTLTLKGIEPIPAYSVDMTQAGINAQIKALCVA